jgi:hypothetical protein
MLEMADIFGYSFSDVIQIDNRALDGFAQHFKTHDCYHDSCDECGHCRRWAEKVVRINEGKRQSILKKFDAFIEAIAERKTLTETVVPDVSRIRLSPEATSVLDQLMAHVPPPLSEIVRAKTLDGAMKIKTRGLPDASNGPGTVGAEEVVRAFWMGTPEPSRDPVRQTLEKMGFGHVMSA